MPEKSIKITHSQLSYIVYNMQIPCQTKNYTRYCINYIEADVLVHIGYEIDYFECSLETNVLSHSEFPHFFNGSVLELTDPLA